MVPDAIVMDVSWLRIRSAIVNKGQKWGAPCRDGVSSFDDDVHAVGKVGRMDDEAIFECKGLVRRAHDGVPTMDHSVTGNIQG